MDKGYYYIMAYFLISGEEVAIHNKNGQGLLQDMSKLSNEDLENSRNPQ